METEIVIENYFENILEANKIAFRLSSKKTLIAIAGDFLLGIYFLTDGLRKRYDISNTSTRYTENTNTVIKNVSYTNYHINTDIGVVLIMLSLLTFFYLYRQKKLFNKAVLKYYYSCKRASQKCLIKLNEQSIFYQDFELTTDEKWSRISKYNITNGYLFLIRNDSYLDSIPIKISKIENNKFEDLMAFIKQRIVEKKVKGII